MHINVIHMSFRRVQTVYVINIPYVCNKVMQFVIYMFYNSYFLCSLHV